MTPSEYRAAVARLGYNQTTIAPLLRITQRTSQRYASGGAPEAVDLLLAYMAEHGTALALEKLEKETGR